MTRLVYPPSDTTTNGRGLLGRRMPPQPVLMSRPEIDTSEGQRVHWSSTDSYRAYITDDPTATKLVSYLKQVDQGNVGRLHELNEEMESKDPWLQGIANTRRTAVTALDWSIVPDHKAPAELKNLAAEAAQFVQEELDEIDEMHDTLVHLNGAISTNLTVTENLWEECRLVGFNDVPGHRLNFRPTDGPEVYVEQQGNSYAIPCDPGKFVTFTPNARAGHPYRVSLLRAQIWMYLIKHFALADWAAFSEKFGLPFVGAQLPEDASENDRSSVEDLLRYMTSDGWAAFPPGVVLQMQEVARGTQPFEALLDWATKQQTILYLGQSLTTDTQGVGSLALGKVHDNVRTDLLTSDLQNERRMIRQQIIYPMCALRFPRYRVPLPHFKREVIEQKNLDEERLTMDQITKAQELGLVIPEDWAYQALGIPQPQPEEEETGSEVDIQIDQPNEAVDRWRRVHGQSDKDVSLNAR